MRRFYATAMSGKPAAHEKRQAARSFGAILEKWLVLDGRPPAPATMLQEQAPALLELSRRLAQTLEEEGETTQQNYSTTGEQKT